jgi:hypothetical protein
MIFKEIDKSEIYTNHNNCYHDDADYYEIIKNDKPLCIYGVISRSDNIGEAFWIMDSFNDKVFCKNFFYSLFKHASSLKYKEIYTWTRCNRLINIFGKFNTFGIEKVASPKWDNDQTKTWFMRSL